MSEGMVQDTHVQTSLQVCINILQHPDLLLATVRRCFEQHSWGRLQMLPLSGCASCDPDPKAMTE